MDQGVEKDQELFEALQKYFGQHLVDDRKILDKICQTVLADKKAGLFGDTPWAVLNRQFERLLK